MQPLEYCLHKIQDNKSAMAFRFPFLSRSKKHALVVLYALQQELQEVVSGCLDVNAAMTTLDWWQSEIVQLYCHDAIPVHPLMQALKKTISIYSFAEEDLLALVTAKRMQLGQCRFEVCEQLHHYALQSGLVLGRLSTRILGFMQQETMQFADETGRILQLISMFSRIGADARQGRIYIPMDVLQHFAVPARLLLNAQDSDELAALLNFLLSQLKQSIILTIDLLPKEDRVHQCASIFMLAAAYVLLQEIEQDGVMNILRYQLVLPRPRQQRLAWKVWLCGFRPKY